MLVKKSSLVRIGITLPLLLLVIKPLRGPNLQQQFRGVRATTEVGAGS